MREQALFRMPGQLLRRTEGSRMLEPGWLIITQYCCWNRGVRFVFDIFEADVDALHNAPLPSNVITGRPRAEQLVQLLYRTAALL